LCDCHPFKGLDVMQGTPIQMKRKRNDVASISHDDYMIHKLHENSKFVAGT